MAIEVTWIGTAGEPVTLMQQVAGHVEQIFGGAASVRAARRLPDGAYDVRRRQYASRALLMTLAGGAGDHKVLGITDVDLFIPVLTFVFGEAQLGGRVAVVSTARLADAGPHGMRARLMKEAESSFADGRDVLATLSVRSAFDLLLSALELPAVQAHSSISRT